MPRMLNTNFFQGVTLLVLSQVCGMLLSFLFNSVVAKNVTTEIFGEFSLFLSVISVLIIISNFGLFYSLPVILASKPNVSPLGPYVGACLVIAVLTGMMICLLLFFCFTVLNVFDNQINITLVYLTPLLIFAPFREVLLQMGKGLNYTSILVLVRTGIPATMLCSLYILLTEFELTVSVLLTLQYGSFAICSFLTFFFLKPVLRGTLSILMKIIEKNRDYGKRVYGAHLFASTWPEIIILILSFYSTMTEVAYYRVALLLISPLILISQNIGTYFFKSFQYSARIDNKFHYINMLIVVLQLAVYLMIIKTVVSIFFGNAYSDALLTIYIMSSGASLSGLYQITDSFMNVNSQGNSILHSSLLMGCSAVVIALILTPKLGATGAAVAYSVGNLVYLVAITNRYQKYVRQR